MYRRNRSHGGLVVRQSGRCAARVTTPLRKDITMLRRTTVEPENPQRPLKTAVTAVTPVSVVGARR